MNVDWRRRELDPVPGHGLATEAPPRPALIDGRERAAPPARRRWLVGAGLGGLALAAWLGLGRHHAAAPAAGAPSLPAVTVTVPGRSVADRTVTGTGSLAARRDMPVGIAGEGGAVRRVLVEPGQWVRAGQVLAEVDRTVQAQTAASLAAAVAVARSDGALAQAELDRARSLVGQGFISKADLQRKAAARDAAQARIGVAQAQLAQQRAANGRLDVRSPTAGLVLTRAVEAGQVVGPASGTLFRIAADGELELRAQLAEADLAGLRPGARAVVTPVGSTRGFPGTVWQVSPVIDPATRQGVARVRLPYDPALRPGGFAQASITVPGAGAVPRLPQSAVQTDAKGNYVYVVGAGGKVARRAVTTGAVGADGVAITAGLAGDERVVVSAGAFLTPGQQVQPVTQRPGQAGARAGG